ncbi:hypothetical protein D3C76_112840 [compost metagenome]
MDTEYHEQTIDLVDVIQKQFPRLDNNLSLKQKNILRREARSKKRAMMNTITSALRSIIDDSL